MTFLPWRIVVFVILAAWAIPGHAQEKAKDSNPQGEGCEGRTSGFTSDVKCYVSAPLRWDGRDWIYFGSAVAAVGIAHHYDTDVRDHFTSGSNSSGNDSSSTDVEDAIPAAGIFAATWLYATVTSDKDGRSESWAMLEAAGFSSATSYLLKFAAGRERPDVTSDPNAWRTGGDSFPSLHTTAAFAIGTVFAESGNDRYRWVRRFVGYGMAAYTGYARLNHNAHWLSDTVAGAGIGISTAHYVLRRQYGPMGGGQVMFVPLDHGAMLTYNLVLP
jgi:PAP2 superfamily